MIARLPSEFHPIPRSSTCMAADGSTSARPRPARKQADAPGWEGSFRGAWWRLSLGEMLQNFAALRFGVVGVGPAFQRRSLVGFFVVPGEDHDLHLGVLRLEEAGHFKTADAEQGHVYDHQIGSPRLRRQGRLFAVLRFLDDR